MKQNLSLSHTHTHTHTQEKVDKDTQCSLLVKVKKTQKTQLSISRRINYSRYLLVHWNITQQLKQMNLIYMSHYEQISNILLHEITSCR